MNLCNCLILCIGYFLLKLPKWSFFQNLRIKNQNQFLQKFEAESSDSTQNLTIALKVIFKLK